MFANRRPGRSEREEEEQATETMECTNTVITETSMYKLLRARSCLGIQCMTRSCQIRAGRSVGGGVRIEEGNPHNSVRHQNAAIRSSPLEGLLTQVPNKRTIIENSRH